MNKNKKNCDMISLDQVVDMIAQDIFASENLCCRNCGSSHILYDDWDKESENIKEIYRNEARDYLNEQKTKKKAIKKTISK